jgi:hypothetical protein
MMRNPGNVVMGQKICGLLGSASRQSLRDGLAELLVFGIIWQK